MVSTQELVETLLRQRMRGLRGGRAAERLRGQAELLQLSVEEVRADFDAMLHDWRRQRRDPRRYVKGVLVHHRLEAVVGGHRGAVVGQLQVHAVRGALSASSTSKADWSALFRGQQALQRGDAASVRGHLPVRGGQGCRRC